MVKLDERWCDCGKFKKFHMPCSHVVAACKHAHREYKNYMHLIYMLKSVFNVYKELFGELYNEAYWSLGHEPMICYDLDKKRNSKGRHVSFRIHTEMDIRESGQSKPCSMCRIPGHSKKIAYRVGSSQQL